LTVYLLDTNVVSELRRARPHGAVLAWLQSVSDAELHISAVTLGEIQASGYATATRTRRLMEEISIAVPVLLHDRVLACLTVRFASSAVPLKNGLERFLPKLRECATKISALFAEQQAESSLKSAAETAA